MIVEYTINLSKSWTDLKYASHKLRYTWKKHAEFYASLIKCFRHTCAIEEMLKLILYTHCKIQNNRLGCSKQD